MDWSAYLAALGVIAGIGVIAWVGSVFARNVSFVDVADHWWAAGSFVKASERGTFYAAQII